MVELAFLACLMSAEAEPGRGPMPRWFADAKANWAGNTYDAKGKPYDVLKRGEEFTLWRIQCYPAEDHEYRLAGMERDDKVLFLGKGEGTAGLSYIRFTGCTFFRADQVREFLDWASGEKYQRAKAAEEEAAKPKRPAPRRTSRR